ncbi:hypothetical protein EXS54_00075 [Patescibacteria group bacterium]|nr:hypothetical protein [Patescibacteria group bacterium]
MEKESFSSGLKGLASNKKLLVAVVVAIGTIVALATFASDGSGYGRVKVITKVNGAQKTIAHSIAKIDCTLPKGARPTYQPSYQPSYQPTSSPGPTYSPEPTYSPGSTYSPRPSYQPSYQPTYQPGKSGNNKFYQSLAVGADGIAVSNPIPSGSKCQVTMHPVSGYAVTNSRVQTKPIARKKTTEYTFKLKKQSK